MNTITKALLGIVTGIFVTGATGWAYWMSDAVVELKSEVRELRSDFRHFKAVAHLP